MKLESSTPSATRTSVSQGALRSERTANFLSAAQLTACVDRIAASASAQAVALPVWARTVLYYAARAGDFSECTSSIIAHFAEHDSWVNRSARKKMERAIHKAGCDYAGYDYPQTQHWFAESSRPAEFDESAARMAIERDLRHFERKLKV